MMSTALVECPTDSFRVDVLAGLSRPQKQLSPKYFYDAAGSQLFDAITELPEYYPTQTEFQILRAAAGEMARRCGPRCMLIELGAGSLSKVRLLLDRLNQAAAYVPVDVSGEHLYAAAATLADDYPALNVLPVVADFTRDFPLPKVSAARRVVYFP
ncbi:MAG TPA: L-histidine N(alpha)-methyltransferase, partial [Phycisphaerae bacterium]|nr:L-histidine N(alpha)-methyltransferase [Phycisphaerae bacterium]